MNATLQQSLSLAECHQPEESDVHNIVSSFSSVGFPDSFCKTPSIPRTCGRIVLEKPARSTKHFEDLPQLVNVIEDSVRALQHTYFNHGALQRDISLANIIIHHDDSSTGTRCHLVDFDHSADTTTNIMVPSLLGLSETLPPSDETTQSCLDIWQKLQSRFFPGKHVLPAVGRLSFLYRTTFSAYATAMANLGPLSTEMVETLRLGFLSKDHVIPDFRVKRRHLRDRAGTAPFTSSEILTSRRIFIEGQPKPSYRADQDGTVLEHEWRECIQKSGEVTLIWKHFSRIDDSQPAELQRWRLVCHDAIHDLESLFWVITYICLTRGGLSGHRRQELQPKYIPQSDGELHLRKIHASLFAGRDSRALAAFKVDLFTENAYRSQVSSYFHPTFSPLKPLMDQWWQIVRTVHRFPIFEGFFDYLLAAIADVSGTLSNN